MVSSTGRGGHGSPSKPVLPRRPPPSPSGCLLGRPHGAWKVGGHRPAGKLRGLTLNLDPSIPEKFRVIPPASALIQAFNLPWASFITRSGGGMGWVGEHTDSRRLMLGSMPSGDLRRRSPHIYGAGTLCYSGYRVGCGASLVSGSLVSRSGYALFL